MTRPIALTIALTFAGPAFAADSAEPMPSDDTSEATVAEKSPQKKNGARTANGQNVRPAQKQQASKAKVAGNKQHTLPASARSQRSSSHQRSSDTKSRSQQASGSRANQSSHARAGTKTPAQARASHSRAQTARTSASKAKASTARNQHQRATSQKASSHQRATSQKASSHKSASSHQRSSSHKRASAHSSATKHRRAVTSARTRWARSWSAHKGHYKRQVHWYHGVFVYGPKPVYHGHYNSVRASGGSGKKQNAKAMPNRKVDRNGDFGIALNTGTYLSGYDQGGDFSDFGLGLSAKFRPVETVGFELAYSYHNDTFDDTSERSTSLIQPSIQVYAFPWTRVSPYASLGLTWASRSYEDTWSDGFTAQTEVINSTAFGPSLGAGVEFALGESAAIDLEAKYNGFLNVGGADPNVPGALQAGAGLTFYF